MMAVNIPVAGHEKMNKAKPIQPNLRKVFVIVIASPGDPDACVNLKAKELVHSKLERDTTICF